MKGVILAGGRGTRLNPLTESCNKHLLMVGKEPMIYNPIRQLLSAGIRDILITSGGEHIEEISGTVGRGSSLGCSIAYKVQKQPNGIADALLLAEDFACGEALAVILGDNIATHSIRAYADEFNQQGVGAKVLLKKVRDPMRYGVAVIEESAITSIVEKPQKTTSNWAVTGIYFYDSRVFEIIRSVESPTMGELGITPVNNSYLGLGQLSYSILKGHWTDAGTMESLAYANQLLRAVNNKIISE